MKNYKNLPITIKSQKGGYRLCFERSTSEYLVIEDNFIVMSAKRMTFDDFVFEIEQNECFNIFEVFETLRGNKFIYAHDFETDEDFIININ